MLVHPDVIGAKPGLDLPPRWKKLAFLWLVICVVAQGIALTAATFILLFTKMPNSSVTRFLSNPINAWAVLILLSLLAFAIPALFWMRLSVMSRLPAFGIGLLVSLLALPLITMPGYIVVSLLLSRIG